eukprot:gene7699-5401_t
MSAAPPLVHITPEDTRLAVSLLLWRLAETYSWWPDPLHVRELVEAGADVVFTPSSRRSDDTGIPFAQQHANQRDAGDGIQPFRPPSVGGVLHVFIAVGNTDCVRECLKTRRVINFNTAVAEAVTDRSTLLLCFSAGTLLPRENVEIVSLMLHRLETHLGDVMNWGWMDFPNGHGLRLRPPMGEANELFGLPAAPPLAALLPFRSPQSLLARVVQQQKLSALWGLLRNVPYYEDNIEPIPLSLCGFVWEWDWNALVKAGLSEDECGRPFFSLSGARIIPASQPTGELCALSHLRSHRWQFPIPFKYHQPQQHAGNQEREPEPLAAPDPLGLLEKEGEEVEDELPVPPPLGEDPVPPPPAMVGERHVKGTFDHATLHAMRRCVAVGADVQLFNPLYDQFVLHHMVLQGDVEALNICLDTPRTINYNLRDGEGRTLLQCVFWGADRTPKDVERLLRALLSRATSGRDTMLNPVTHRNDNEINWMLTDRLGYDFLSVAALFRCLSIVWPLLLEQDSLTYFHPWRDEIRKAEASDMWDPLERRLKRLQQKWEAAAAMVVRGLVDCGGMPLPSCVVRWADRVHASSPSISSSASIPTAHAVEIPVTCTVAEVDWWELTRHQRRVLCPKNEEALCRWLFWWRLVVVYAVVLASLILSLVVMLQWNRDGGKDIK